MSEVVKVRFYHCCAGKQIVAKNLVRVAREMGVVRFGTLSVEGTKVRANASKRKAMSHWAGAHRPGARSISCARSS